MPVRTGDPSQIEHVISGLARIYSALALATKAAALPADDKLAVDFGKILTDAKAGVETSLDDDFNTRAFDPREVFPLSPPFV